MSDRNFVEAIRTVAAHQIGRAPKRHRLRTTDCPSLAELAGDPDDWTAADRKHVADCPYCNRVLDMLEGGPMEERPDVVPFRQPLVLPQPNVFAADASDPIDLSGKAPGTAVQWRLKQDGERLVLQLRTHEAVTGQAVACELHGAKGARPVAARLVFGEESLGWVVARTAWPLDRLHRKLRGECRALRIGPLEEKETAAEGDLA